MPPLGPRAQTTRPRRPAPHASAGFGAPLARADAPITTAQHVARQRVQRAQQRLPQRPLPAIPTLAHPTQRQASTAVALGQRSLQRQVPRNLPPAQRAAATVGIQQEVRQDPRERARVAPIVAAQAKLDRDHNVRMGLVAVRRDPASYGVSGNQLAGLHHAAARNRLPDMVRTQLAQIGEGVHRALAVQQRQPAPAQHFHVSKKSLAGIASNPVGFLAKQAAKQAEATGLAFWQHPGQTASKTASGLAEQVVGLPAALGEMSREAGFASSHGDVPGVLRALTRPATEMGLDVQRRYSGSVKSRAARIAKEGASAEIGDLATALSAGGESAGRLLVRTAGEGALGARAARFANEPRPLLRYSGGAGVREQDLANRPTRIAVQRLQDRLRTRRAGRVDSEGRLIGLQPQNPGEVVPMFQRTQAREQRIAASRASARSYIGTRHEQTAEITHGAEKELAALSPRQRRAVFHVSQGLLPLGEGVDAIRGAIHDHIDQITKEQAAAGVTEPRVLARHTELRTLRFLDKHAPEIFGDRRLADFHAANLARQERLAENDPGLKSATALARRYRPQGERLGIHYDPADRTGPELESYQRDYAAQVKAKAEPLGLPEPAYFKHTKRLLPRLSLRTGGNVSKGIAGVKRSDMKLLREGRAVTNPDVLMQGLAENIKRKHQWNAVSDVVDEHAFNWSRGKSGGHSISTLQDEIDRRGLRHEDISFLNLGVMRKAAAGAGESDAALHDALTKGIYSGAEARKLAENGDEIVKTRGYVAMPREVANELLQSTRPPSRGLRLASKFQGLQSAGILGLNPSFLQVQIAANTIQGGAALRGNFADLARGQSWYRHLDPAQRKIVDESLGVGAFEGHAHVSRLGSTAGGLARTLESIGRVPVLRTPHGAVRLTDLNPTNAMFRADAAQNTAFRKAVFYNDLKRQAFHNLGRDIGHAQASMKVLSDWANLRPGETLNHAAARLLSNPRAVEKAARNVDDALGDYLRYTARERRLLKPTVIFYGFFRYALKTLFYTLPAKHPLLGSIGLKLGQLHNEELRRIFGTRDIPAYALSRALTFDRQGNPVKTPEGTYKTVDFGRVNPLTSPATDLVTEGPQRLAGLVSPLTQVGLNLIARKNIGMDKPLTLHGSAAEAKHIGPLDALRVVGNETLGALWPYRLGMAARTGGRTQSDDSLLFSERPVTYKTPDSQQREAERVASRGSFTGALAQQALPLVVPRIDRTAQSIAARRASGAQSTGLAGLPPAEARALLREARHAARQQVTPAARAQVAAEQREALYLARQTRR